MRFDPFRELDRLAQQGWGGTRTTMPMDAYRRGDRFVVHLDLPGIDPNSVELTVEKNVLTVSAERAADRQEGDEWLVAERPEGSFSRQLFLGETLDTDHIEANYDQGVLTVTIPLAEQARPRKVAIQSGGTKQQAIQAQSEAA